MQSVPVMWECMRYLFLDVQHIEFNVQIPHDTEISGIRPLSCSFCISIYHETGTLDSLLVHIVPYIFTLFWFIEVARYA